MRRIAALGVLALAGCGSSLHLQAAGFVPPDGATPAGQRIPAGQVARVPAYRLAVHAGDTLRFRVTLRNTGTDAVSVTGVAHDTDVDGYLVPAGIEPSPLRIGAGRQATATVTARVPGCGDSAPGQLREKQGQVLQTSRGRGEVRLGAILSVTCG